MKFDGKELTISKSDLTAKEEELMASLIRLGDSEDMALWTIQHMERVKIDNSEDYRNAYYS